MNSDFSVGDVVVLKSGGPKMVITGKSVTGTHYCLAWFGPSGTLLNTGQLLGLAIKLSGLTLTPEEEKNEDH